MSDWLAHHVPIPLKPVLVPLPNMQREEKPKPTASPVSDRAALSQQEQQVEAL